jgi:glycopeptide antibiotics resistance protein
VDAGELSLELKICAVLDAGIIWNVINQRALLTILGATVVLAWPLGRLLGRGALGVVFVVTLGATLAATTTTELPYYSVRGIELYLREFAHPTDLLTGFASKDERLANVGLFIPLGSVATLLWHRPIVAVCACAALSFVIEGWQGFIGRGGDAVDVVHNSAGALLGVGAGCIALISHRRRPDRPAKNGSVTE